MTCQYWTVQPMSVYDVVTDVFLKTIARRLFVALPIVEATAISVAVKAIPVPECRDGVVAKEYVSVVPSYPARYMSGGESVPPARDISSETVRATV